MTGIEYLQEQPVPVRRKTSGLIWNLLTILVLLTTLCIGAVFTLIFVNPQSGLNPFPPPTMPAVLAFPTATNTPVVQLPATWTPEPTPEPSPTPTLRPTSTPFPTETPFYLATPETGEGGQTEAAEPEENASPYPYVVHNGRIIAIENIYHADAGCSWSGVGGQVFDMKGGSINGLTAFMGGMINGRTLQTMPTIVGALDIPGYYEFTLADAPFDSTGKLWVQLYDQSGQIPLSEKVYFDTYNDCQKNLIIINFQQVR